MNQIWSISQDKTRCILNDQLLEHHKGYMLPEASHTNHMDTWQNDVDVSKPVDPLKMKAHDCNLAANQRMYGHLWNEYIIELEPL
jgi:hypothetical protein